MELQQENNTLKRIDNRHKIIIYEKYITQYFNDILSWDGEEKIIFNEDTFTVMKDVISTFLKICQFVDYKIIHKFDGEYLTFVVEFKYEESDFKLNTITHTIKVK